MLSDIRTWFDLVLKYIHLIFTDLYFIYTVPITMIAVDWQIKKILMMTSSNGFIALLALCARNSPVNGEFPAERPVTRSFGVFFHLCLNKRLSKQSWGCWFWTPSRSLWRHCNGYCPACRTSLIATRFWVVMICPIIKCLTVLEFSFILFDLCLFITISILF